MQNLKSFNLLRLRSSSGARIRSEGAEIHIQYVLKFFSEENPNNLDEVSKGSLALPGDSSITWIESDSIV